MEDGTVDLTNTAILAVVRPTPDQLAEAHISAQMLEDDRALLSIQGRSHERRYAFGGAAD